MTIFEYIRNEIIALGYLNVYTGSYNDDYDNIVNIKRVDPIIPSDSAFGINGAITTARNLEIEIIVRNTDFDTGYACMDAIRAHFSAHRHATKQLDIIAKSDILTEGNDEHNRSKVKILFKIKAIGGTTL